MEIKVLGTGCAKCKKLYAEAEKAIAQLGRPVTLTKVEEIEKIMTYGVYATPALVVGEQVKSSGRVTPAAEILTWLQQATG
jgi:small redox-active disulfide protein 2